MSNCATSVPGWSSITIPFSQNRMVAELNLAPHGATGSGAP
jgi:hypothetical protein